ncbi:hypothetical protein [Parachryseolinea silvisoli]|uniref:hypothetical protein n=1 Tax=Parachryseolinea silvisoli TaxID=2873601 RepID=UPI0022659CE0|nr:hypothetical protein [Parachryseolinea silvisoli]MCD9015464.1 hypothetical protein [Parachryseolinea silvisoli]
MKKSLALLKPYGIIGYLAAMLSFVSNVTVAQTSLPAGCDSVRMAADVMPVYKRGIQDFAIEFRKAMKLRDGCRPDKIVFKWIVDKNGKLSNIEVTAADADDKCREDYIHILESMAAWTPGSHKGKPVCVRMVMPMYVDYKVSNWNDD